MKERMDGVKISAEPGIEMAQVALADLGLEAIEDIVQERVGNLFVHNGPGGSGKWPGGLPGRK
jgi:hypothetical protein